MDGFDTITMSYLATPMSLSHVTQDALHVPLNMLDNLEHHSNYDAETFAGYAKAPSNALLPLLTLLLDRQPAATKC